MEETFGAGGLSNDVQERIALIESMMLEGRRTTQYWGWSFVLWGAAYLVAIASAALTHRPGIAWPVTMILAAALTTFLAKAKTKGQPRTTKSRGVTAIWVAVGCSLFVYTFSAGFSGHNDMQSFAGAVETLLGVAYFSAGLLLRWRLEQVLGGIYWAAAAACFFQSPQAIGFTFIGLTVVCQIGFGAYLMVRESRDRRAARARQVSHA